MDYDKLTGIRPADSSASVQARADAARERQNLRFEGTSLHTNADMGPAKIRQFCALDETGRRLMRAAMRQLDLSARGYHRVLKLARTIADLAGSEGIEPQHLAEALQYRERRGEQEATVAGAATEVSSPSTWWIAVSARCHSPSFP